MVRLKNNTYKIPYQEFLDGVQDIPDPCLILIGNHDHHRLLEKPLILKEEEGEEGYCHGGNNEPADYCHDIACKIGD